MPRQKLYGIVVCHFPDERGEQGTCYRGFSEGRLFRGMKADAARSREGSGEAYVFDVFDPRP